MLEVIWSGRVRNSERIVLSEIPCSFTGNVPFRECKRCVKRSPGQLAAGTITQEQRARFLESAVRAFQEK